MKKKRRNSTKDRDLGIRISVPSLMVFSGGLFLGYFLGGGGNVDTAVDVSNQLALANALGDNTELRGWKTLNVFYGDTYHSETSLPKQKWFSQARQDEAIASLLAEKRDGYFVDLAANDATILSNTYALERHYGWKGLCIEPNPIYFYNLTHYRPNCEVVAAVVGHTRMEEIYFYNAGDHSGIIGFDNPQRLKKKSRIEYTVTIREIFEKFSVPKVIDYLSLDVEGAELFILGSFPFDVYKVSLITIERPNPDLRSLLAKHGYEQIQRLTSWGETLWAHNETLKGLDTTRLDDFNAKKQRLEARKVIEKS